MVKYGVKQSMSTVSKLGNGIQTPVDSEDYFICRLCRTLVKTDEMMRHMKRCHIIQTDTEWSE